MPAAARSSWPPPVATDPRDRRVKSPDPDTVRALVPALWEAPRPALGLSPSLNVRLPNRYANVTARRFAPAPISHRCRSNSHSRHVAAFGPWRSALLAAKSVPLRISTAELRVGTESVRTCEYVWVR